jgi:hypothetical protein
VYRSSDPTKELIAKKIREESNELEIFKILDTTQPKSEHIISLLDSFHAPSGWWAILPRMESIADYIAFAPNRLASQVGHVCLGLLHIFTSTASLTGTSSPILLRI